MAKATIEASARFIKGRSHLQIGGSISVCLIQILQADHTNTQSSKRPSKLESSQNKEATAAKASAAAAAAAASTTTTTTTDTVMTMLSMPEVRLARPFGTLQGAYMERMKQRREKKKQSNNNNNNNSNNNNNNSNHSGAEKKVKSKRVRFDYCPEVHTVPIVRRSECTDLWWSDEEIEELKLESRGQLDMYELRRYIHQSVTLHSDVMEGKEVEGDYVKSLLDGMDLGYRGMEHIETRTGALRKAAMKEAVSSVVAAQKTLKKQRKSRSEVQEELRSVSCRQSETNKQYALIIAEADALASV
jgi:hypothetical protein